MNVFDRLARIGVVPVVAIDDANQALNLADALAEGGLPLAEITFRTVAAAETIRKIAKGRPDFLVGAGTVIDADQIAASLEAGAEFALAPGTDPDMIALAKRASLPYSPGIATPSDLQIALRLGCRFLKFFPAGLLGGPKMLTNIAAPLCPSGRVVQSDRRGQSGQYERLAHDTECGGRWRHLDRHAAGYRGRQLGRNHAKGT